MMRWNSVSSTDSASSVRLGVSGGRLKMREWKMRHGQKCKGGKCRSSLAVDGQLNLECKETALSYFMENV